MRPDVSSLVVDHEESLGDFAWSIVIDTIALIDKLVVSGKLRGFLIVTYEVLVLPGHRMVGILRHGTTSNKIIASQEHIIADERLLTQSNIISKQSLFHTHLIQM